MHNELTPSHRAVRALAPVGAVLLFVAVASGCTGGARSQYELAKFAAASRQDAKTTAVEARSMLLESERELVAYKTAALDAKLIRQTESVARRQGGVIFADQARAFAKNYAADQAAMTAARAARANKINAVTRKISLAGDNIDALMRAEDARAQTAVALQEFAQAEFVRTAEDLVEFQAETVARQAAIEAAQAAQAATAEAEPPGEEAPPDEAPADPDARR